MVQHGLHGVAGYLSGAETASETNYCFFLKTCSLDTKNSGGGKKEFPVSVFIKGVIFVL